MHGGWSGVFIHSSCALAFHSGVLNHRSDRHPLDHFLPSQRRRLSILLVHTLRLAADSPTLLWLKPQALCFQRVPNSGEQVV